MTTRPFIIWLALCLAAFSATGGGYHLYLKAHPRKTLVIVDSSFSMRAVWDRLPALLGGICDDPYTQYALITEKSRIHGWADGCALGTVTPYAPRDLSALGDSVKFTELVQAERIILVTNGDAPPTDYTGKWEIVDPGGD